jgi:hypothetical protein
MRLRALSSVTAALLLTLVSADVQSQSRGYAVPRTPWGEPDLQGTYNATDLQSVPMQRAESLGTRDTLNDAEVRERVARRDEALAHDNSDEFTLEHAEEFANKFPTVFWGGVAPPPHWLERVKHVSRIASIVIDPPNGRIPALTLEAQKAAQERQQAQAARRKALNGIEAEWTTDRSNYDRCISLGVQGSMTPKIYNSATRIVQGPGWVAIQNEMIHETRMIPVDGRANISGAITAWMGNSVGRWDGDTLVVETRNVKPESSINGQPLSSHGVLIERITLADANTLDYRLTVVDPKTWTAPWTMRMPIPREDAYGFYEYGCHEGNYALSNLLSGSRAEEKRRTEAGKGSDTTR